MANLDSILNVVIPIGIIIFFAGLIYWKLKEPLQSFFGWMKEMFSSASGKMGEVNLPTEIVYS